MNDGAVRQSLRLGDLDHARVLVGVPEPFAPGPDCPALRFVQEANRFKAIGRIEEGRGRLLAAEVCYRVALRFVPGDWEALGAIGRLLARAGLAYEAEPYLRAAIWSTRGPIRADLHLVRGRLRLREGRAAGAWRDIQAAIRQDPQSSEAMEALGVLKRRGVPLWARISPAAYLAVVCGLAGIFMWGKDLGTVLLRLVGG